MTLLTVLERTTTYLEGRGIPSPKFEAQLLLAHVLEMDRLQLFMQFERPLSEAELASLREPVRRRGSGEPFAYISGTKEFWSLDFEVGPGVLIPRPDTETLVEQAKAFCDGGEFFVADICAGSGCVGIALASENPELKLYATEASPEALAYLKRNIAKHDLSTRAAALRGDLLGPIPTSRPIDVVVSNPPYIARQELAGLDVARHEPGMALDGGPDGLDIYRRLIPDAARRARRAVLVEIGHDQGEAVAELFRRAGLTEVRVVKDLAQNDRVVVGQST